MHYNISFLDFFCVSYFPKRDMLHYICKRKLDKTTNNVIEGEAIPICHSKLFFVYFFRCSLSVGFSI